MRVKFLNNLCRENESQLISLKSENESKLNQFKTDAQNQLEARLNEIRELQLVLKEQESRLKGNWYFARIFLSPPPPPPIY